MRSVVRTACPYCGVGCGMRVTAESGEWRIAPDPGHPANGGRVCTKGAALAETIDLEGRLLRPRIRGREVDWDTALTAVAGGFQTAIERYGPESVAFYVSGQLLTEDYYVANKLMKGFIGAANIDTNSRLCMSSAVAGHLRAFGEDLVPGCYEDVELADLIVIVGGNTAWCHPVLFQRLQAARERRPKAELVVIDPRRTATAEAADLHLALAPGTDVALFNGLFRFLEERGCADRDFVRAHTHGLEAARETCADADLPAVARACDVAAADVERFYSLFADHARTVTLFSQGVNQSSSGADKVNAILNCHLLTGRIGRPGSGPFSLTGQPNAMGGREVGALANTLAAHMDFEPRNVDRLRRFWGSERVAGRPGLKALDLFRAIAAGRVKAVWIMATNPVVSLPDADAARRALAACELVVVSDCTAATDTARCADILLPAAAWGEKDGTVTNSERRISRQRRFLPLPGDARPDWWIVCEVAKRLGHAEAFGYACPADIFKEHARLSAFENEGARLFDIGPLAALSNEDYDGFEPMQWPVRLTHGSAPLDGLTESSSPWLPRSSAPSHLAVDASPRIQGTARLFGDRRFRGAEGRAYFVPVRPRAPVHSPNRHFPLILNTGRVRDHWHTLTRTGKSPRLSAHTAEPFVAVHPDDARTLELAPDALAEAETSWGRMLVRVRHDAGQRRGELFVPMHWSDESGARARVGALVNPAADPVSGEPEFKHTPARVRPWPAAWYGFLLMRGTPQPLGNDVDYWIRIRGRGHWRLELAGREPRIDWGPRARRLLGAVRPDCDWLEFQDRRAGCYRLASVAADGRLDACLMIARRPDALPPRDWLGGLFAKPSLDAQERAGLLAGRKVIKRLDE